MASGTPHATLRIAFTPDEEIGRGTDRFDLAHFGADYAYTPTAARWASWNMRTSTPPPPS